MSDRDSFMDYDDPVPVDDLLERLDNMGYEIPPPELIPLAKRCAARIRELEAKLEASQQVCCIQSNAHSETMRLLHDERKARESIQDHIQAWMDRCSTIAKKLEAAEAKLRDINDGLRLALGDNIEGMERERIEYLQERAEAAEKDAERYRFFKSRFDLPWQLRDLAIRLGVEVDHFHPSLDAAIDAAMKEKK